MGSAIGWVKAPGTHGEPVELRAELVELGDAPFDLGLTRREQAEHMGAWRLATVAQGHDAADLAEGEPGGLGGADESETIGDDRLIVAIARRSPGRRLEDSDALVVADGLGWDAAESGQLTDSHQVLTFQCTGTSTVQVVEIEVLTVPDCPNRATAIARVREALRAIGEASAAITELVVDHPDRARETGMHGSPTILLDGRDPFASSSADTSVSCRLYRSDAGLEGAPSVEDLITAIAEARASRDRA